MLESGNLVIKKVKVRRVNSRGQSFYEEIEVEEYYEDVEIEEEVDIIDKKTGKVIGKKIVKKIIKRKIENPDEI